MTRAERDRLREMLANRPDCRGNPCLFGNRGGQRTQGGCHCIPRGGTKPGVTPFIIRLVEAMPALLDQVDAQEQAIAAVVEVQQANLAERDALKAELDEARLSYVKAAGERDRAEAERNSLKAEVERLRQADEMDHRGVLVDKLLAQNRSLTEDRCKAEAERDQARARVAELEKKYTELREDYDAETDGRVKARARVAELEQECRDRQGTEDSLVAWNEEQATRIATLDAALRDHGRHTDACYKKRASQSKHAGIDWDDSECICGLDAALAGGG